MLVPYVNVTMLMRTIKIFISCLRLLVDDSKFLREMLLDGLIISVYTVHGNCSLFQRPALKLPLTSFIRMPCQLFANSIKKTLCKQLYYLRNELAVDPLVWRTISMDYFISMIPQIILLDKSYNDCTLKKSKE